MDKRIVLWSGGYDSTLLVWQEVLRAKKDRNNCIQTWSLDWCVLGDNKLESERLCRKSFMEYISSVHNISVYNEIIKLEHKINPGGHGLMQASMFMPLCSYFAPDDSTIIFGFHKGDDYWYDWVAHEKIKNEISNIMTKKVTFEFPLRYEKKWEVIRSVRNAGIERFCWTCETPGKVMKECGECKPCMNKKVAEYELSLFQEKYKNCTVDDEVDKTVDEIVDEKVEDKLDITERNEDE